ncbi:MAG: hypothetical protein WC391_07140 [Methanoregula sp.]|jgi:hypothetical protein
MTTLNKLSRTWTSDDTKRPMQVSDEVFIAKEIARFNHGDDARMHQLGGIQVDMIL